MTTPSRIEEIDRRRAAELVQEGLLGQPGAHSHSQLTVDCAALRSTLWWLTRYGRTPVHVLRLLNVTVQLQIDTLPGQLAVAESERRTRLRGALSELKGASDVVEMPNGRWLPAPLREIALPEDSEERLLVGGLPTQLLPRRLAAAVAHHGPFRRLQGPGLGIELGLPTEALESWLGQPPRDLRGWAREVLACAALTPYASQEHSQFRFYRPDGPRGISQTSRWIGACDRLPPGRYLALRDLGLGMRQPRVAKIDEGRVVATGSPEFGTGEVRRLMYGLDLVAENPVKVRVARLKDELCVTLRSEIPISERRYFASLGNLTTDAGGRYYPRYWIFPLSRAGVVERTLKALGVEIES